MTLLNLLIKKRIPIIASCGGRGRCGQCLIKILKPKKPDEVESILISPRLLRIGYRLACRRQTNEEFEFKPTRPISKRGLRTGIYGLALDLGTTAIKGAIVDLKSGEMIKRKVITNPQNIIGGDVITRIGVALLGQYKTTRRLLLTGIADLQKN